MENKVGFVSDISNKIVLLYLETFTLEKVKGDIFEHLKRNTNELFTRTNLGYILNAFFENEEDKYETVTISEDDEITVLNYHSFLDFGFDLEFNVIIGIGEFVKGRTSALAAFFKAEKCLAKLRYNPNLSLYDVEFYLTEYNRK